MWNIVANFYDIWLTFIKIWNDFVFSFNSYISIYSYIHYICTLYNICCFREGVRCNVVKTYLDLWTTGVEPWLHPPHSLYLLLLLMLIMFSFCVDKEFSMGKQTVRWVVSTVYEADIFKNYVRNITDRKIQLIKPKNNKKNKIKDGEE